MDLIVGHVARDSFSTCVFAEDYNSCIKASGSFANVAGDEIQVLAVFLKKGPCAKEIHTSLQERQVSDGGMVRRLSRRDHGPGAISDLSHVSGEHLFAFNGQTGCSCAYSKR